MRRSDNELEELAIVLFRATWQLVVLVVVVCVWVGRKVLKTHPQIGVKTEQVAVRSGLARRDMLIGIGIVLLVGAALPFSVASNARYGYLDWYILTLLMLAGGVFILYKAATGTFPTTTSKELASTTTQLPPPTPMRYTIRLPRETEWNSQQALHLIEQLAENRPHFILSLEADPNAIRWQIVEPNAARVSLIARMVRSIYPNAEIEVSELEPELVSEAFFRIVASFKQVSLFVAPITYVTDIKRGSNQFDPLTALTQAMNELQAGERIRVTLGVLGVAEGAHKRGEALITQSTIHPLQWGTGAGIQDALLKKAYHLDRVDRFVYEDQRVLEEKLNHSLYQCVELVQIDGIDTQRTAELTSHLVSQFTHFNYLPFNALDVAETDLEACITYVDSSEKAAQSNAINRIVRLMEVARPNGGVGQGLTPMILEPREIASLWHLPHEDFSASRIRWSRGLMPVSERVRTAEAGVRLGLGTLEGETVPIILPHADRVTHLNLIGRTGTGKSTLLHHLIHQDIALGSGVVVIDPHGNLVRDVLRTSIPAARERDVVLIDAANGAFPAPLNPLRGSGTYAATQRVMSVIERLFDGLDGAPRMANYLRSALLLLSADPEATMRDLSRVFLDDEYRESLLNRIDNPELEDFWDMQFNASSLAMRQQIADPVLSRIRPFYANPYLYPMLCHPDALDFASLLREQKIVLISLAIPEDDVHKQERDLLGALLITQLQIAAMREQRPTPVYVYVDEVQRFVTTSLAEVLAEARKYGVVMTTANQYLGQLTGKTLEAVMGNVGTTVIFGCSPEDATALALYVKPDFTPQKLVNLDRFSAAVKMQVGGNTQPAFSLLTDPPLTVDQDADLREAHLRQTSQQTYVPKTRETVQVWLKARYPRRPTQRGAESPAEETFYE